MCADLMVGIVIHLLVGCCWILFTEFSYEEVKLREKGDFVLLGRQIN